MKLVYEIDIVGFEMVDHAKPFYTAWLTAGADALFARARDLANRADARGCDLTRFGDCYSSQPDHGSPPFPGWQYRGCLGTWRFGDTRTADRHCLEVFRAAGNELYLVDQAEHGDFQGHSFETTVLCRVPDVDLEDVPLLEILHADS